MTATVSPPASSAPRWAAPSMPTASPETTRDARLGEPMRDACRQVPADRASDAGCPRRPPAGARSGTRGRQARKRCGGGSSSSWSRAGYAASSGVSDPATQGLHARSSMRPGVLPRVGWPTRAPGGPASRVDARAPDPSRLTRQRVTPSSAVLASPNAVSEALEGDRHRPPACWPGRSRPRALPSTHETSCRLARIDHAVAKRSRGEDPRPGRRLAARAGRRSCAPPASPDGRSVR